MANSKFEKLIELIINEDEKGAQKVFHDIVVAESRKIYEDLQDEEMGAEGMADELEADHDVIDGDEEGTDELGGGDEFGGEEGFGGEGDELGDELGGEEGGIEDRVMDLEDALDELKAEFDALMGEEEAEGHDVEDLGGEEDFGGEEDEFSADDGEFDASDDAWEIGAGDEVDDEGEEKGFGEASI